MHVHELHCFNPFYGLFKLRAFNGNIAPNLKHAVKSELTDVASKILEQRFANDEHEAIDLKEKTYSEGN